VANIKAQIKYATFARSFFADPEHNGTKAAITAGYSAKTAYSMAHQLLKKLEVQAILDDLRARAARKLEITGEKVLKELALMGFARAKEYFDSENRFVGMNALTSEQSAGLQEVTIDEERRGTRSGRGRKAKRGTTSTVTRTRVKLVDKRANLELLGKHLKLFGADDHGASAAVKVIIVNSPRPNRPQSAVLVQQGKPELTK
jgi:phage terminase small subunit